MLSSRACSQSIVAFALRGYFASNIKKIILAVALGEVVFADAFVACFRHLFFDYIGHDAMVHAVAIAVDDAYLRARLEGRA